MHLLQTAVATDSYSTYLQFSRGVADLPPVYLRDLLQFNFPDEGVPVDQVEAITEIRKRFVTPGMSLGALSARGARDAGDRDEPDRRQGGVGRGRRGQGALSRRTKMATTPIRGSSRSPRAASA